MVHILVVDTDMHHVIAAFSSYFLLQALFQSGPSVQCTFLKLKLDLLQNVAGEMQTTFPSTS